MVSCKWAYCQKPILKKCYLQNKEGAIMSDLLTCFEKAQADVKTLSERPDNQTMLELYANYKQATLGDVSGERPGMMDFVNRMKYDAWDKLKGTSKDDAMQRYTDTVQRLLES